VQRTASRSTPPRLSTNLHDCDEIVFEPADNQRLANLCGQFDEHLRQVERRLGVEIHSRGNGFLVSGEPSSVKTAGQVLRALYDDTLQSTVTPARVHLLLQGMRTRGDASEEGEQGNGVHLRRALIRARGPNQQYYLRSILRHDISFGIGPAGTGKTYLAVACAVDALERERVQRLVLVRPAVEAGERLGFLPGDLIQKVDPYLRPLYDALYEMLGFERVAKLTERNVIEVAPLAYMRGRTLNDAFVILDEAQNTTIEQMKMFLTRIGFGSKAVINGDVTQVDLPRDRPSGLKHVVQVLKEVEGISFVYFDAQDVVRHSLVQSIVEAYEAHEKDDGRAG
jgi:phosphate starvation-inducible protein PhoH and related proteins